jgi:hypothetical protein
MESSYYFSLVYMAKQAIQQNGKDIPMEEVTIGIKKGNTGNSLITHFSIDKPDTRGYYAIHSHLKSTNKGG